MANPVDANSFLVDGVGLWVQRSGNANFEGRPAVFLDRDGVIVEEVHFLSRPQDVRLTAGVGQAIGRLNRMGVPVIVVTNQSGIARGHFDWTDFAIAQAEIGDQLARAGGAIDATFACGYHQDGSGALGIADHPWRKPGFGMLREAHKLLGVDLGRSTIIGDRLTDLEAGRCAGLPNGTIVGTGYGERERKRLAEASEKWREQGFSVSFADHAAQAIRRWAAGGTALRGRKSGDV
jgi:D-glycero-D-manno-heptose 1,7-bisphosphate phosphatase